MYSDFLLIQESTAAAANLSYVLWSLNLECNPEAYRTYYQESSLKFSASTWYIEDRAHHLILVNIGVRKQMELFIHMTFSSKTVKKM